MVEGVVKTVTNFAAFVSCGVGRPTRRLRPDGKPAVMEEVDGFLGKDDVPEGEGVALSSQLVKKAGTEVIIREGAHHERMRSRCCVVVMIHTPSIASWFGGEGSRFYTHMSGLSVTGSYTPW